MGIDYEELSEIEILRLTIDDLVTLFASTYKGAEFVLDISDDLVSMWGNNELLNLTAGLFRKLQYLVFGFVAMRPEYSCRFEIKGYVKSNEVFHSELMVDERLLLNTSKCVTDA